MHLTKATLKTSGVVLGVAVISKLYERPD